MALCFVVNQKKRLFFIIIIVINGPFTGCAFNVTAHVSKWH